MRFAFEKRKDLQLELKENIACKDDILKEYKEIRHEYNNMLQSILCFIEEEDWESLKDYKVKLLEKTKVLNGNNLTQLVKLKNKRILSLVYKLLIRSKESGVQIGLTIYNDIEDMTFYEKSLEECINWAYDRAVDVGGLVNLKISGNTEGICFAFENNYNKIDSNNILELINTKRGFKSKNIFLNTFIEGDRVIQEISICQSFVTLERSSYEK